MKVVQISSTCGSGSIGKICQSVSELLSAEGIENYVLYTQGKSSYNYAIKYSSHFKTKKYALLSRLLGNYGFNSCENTKNLLRELERIKPDIIHIHNIHSHDCNFEALFKYIKKNTIKVFYTFHDCWAFTGYCMYFDSIECNKWKTSCKNCPQRKKYSWYFDRCNDLYNRKKESFEGVNLTVITPSKWMADLVSESFLKNYPRLVINNGIDLTIFKPTPSNFRMKYGCEDKTIIMGIASVWEDRKGLNTFVNLSKQLSDDYQIVLVGTTESIDKLLPANIISIHRTEGQRELAAIYTAADILVNPTMEENFPTVNIEAIACGTPVFTYNTGGSSEMLNEKCGKIIQKGNYHQLLSEILLYRSSHSLKSEDCVAQACKYNQSVKFHEYIELYK